MTDELPDLAAAELALGVLDGDERAAAVRRQLADPAFAAEVAQWRDRLAVMLDDVPAAEPGPALFARIERSLSPSPARPAVRRLFWPSVATLSTAAAAVLAVALVQRPPAQVPSKPAVPAPAPLLVAAIAPTGAGNPVGAVYDARAGSVRLTAATLADARHAAELWVIGGDGKPYSLGLLRPGAATALPVSAANRARLAVDAVLAVSIEPLGGSPTGLPTGPVVAKGALSIT